MHTCFQISECNTMLKEYNGKVCAKMHIQKNNVGKKIHYKHYPMNTIQGLNCKGKMVGKCAYFNVNFKKHSEIPQMLFDIQK